MIQSEFEVKNEYGNVVMRTEDKKKADDIVAANPEKLKVEEKKYYQEVQPAGPEKSFMEARA